MLATFKRRIQNGERPKQAVKISYPRARDIYYPYEDTILFPEHPTRIIRTGTVYLDITQDLQATSDGQVINMFASSVDCYIGFTVPFQGVRVTISKANGNAMTLAGKYWNGSAWTAIDIIDGTSAGGKSLAQSGDITWNPVSDWTTTQYNGYTLYWMQFSTAASPDGEQDEVELLGAQFDYKIYNKCLSSIGDVHSQFNIQPKDYGETISNLSLSFHNNDLMNRLIYHENWRSAWVQLIHYFADYTAADGSSATLTDKSQKLIATYDFGNNDGTVQIVKFLGIITEQPSFSDRQITCNVESWESFYSRKKIPKYTLTRDDFDLIPEYNAGKASKVIVGNDTKDKLLVKVKEGASAIIASKGEDYTATDTEITFENLDKFRAHVNKGKTIMTMNREKMLVMDFDSDQFSGNNTVTFRRAQGYTDAELPQVGQIIYEYKPQEKWFVTEGTIGTGQDFTVHAINPDDDAERWVIPSDWYTMIYNGTASRSGYTFSHLETIRPAYGYFPSTEESDKQLRSSQGEGVNPTQAIEERPTTTSVQGGCVEWNGGFGDLEYHTCYATFPDDTGIISQPGWFKVNAAFHDGAGVTTFRGDPAWDGTQVPYVELKLKIPNNPWSQSTYRTPIELNGGSSALWRCNFRAYQYPTSIDATGMYWFVRYDAENTPLISCEKLIQSANSNTDHGLYTQDPTPLIAASDGLYMYQFNHDAWSGGNLQDTFGIIVSSSYVINQYSPAGGTWGETETTLDYFSLLFTLRANMWSSADLANLVNNNFANSVTANGYYTSDLDTMWGTSYLMEQRLNIMFDEGDNDWPAKPAGTLSVSRAQLKIKWRCDLLHTDPDQEFYFNIYKDGNDDDEPDMTIDFKALNQTYTAGDTNGGDSNPFLVNVHPVFNNGEKWGMFRIEIVTKLGYTATAPVELWGIQLQVDYISDTTYDNRLWTDDEYEFSPDLGSYCQLLKYDGERSYCWLKARNPGDDYRNKDGVVIVKCEPKDMNFGLVRKVYLRMTTQINPMITTAGGEYTGVGGCMHQTTDDKFHKAAWCWYSHFNHRSDDWTGQAGSVLEDGYYFDDADAEFETWGVRGIQNITDLTITYPDILYIDIDGDEDTATNQGTYVIWEVINDTRLEIRSAYTNDWDIEKVEWGGGTPPTGWDATETGIKYRIHRPFELPQQSEMVTTEFDITDMFDDWDSSLDFDKLIYVRGHLYTDSLSSYPNPPTAQYYDNPDNDSLFRLWMPKLRIIYNDGRDAIITIRGIDGVNSGSENPAEMLDHLLQAHGDMDDSLIDTDSRDSVEDSIGTSRKVDYDLDDFITVSELIHKFSYYFGYSVHWLERFTYRDGLNPKVLDGTVITSDTQVQAYGQDTEFEDHDYSEHGHAATITAYGTESNGTTGFAITGGALSSTATPRTGSTGSYAVTCTASGSEMITELTYTTGVPLNVGTRLICWVKGNVAMTVEFGAVGTNLVTGGEVIDVRSFVVSTGWTRIYVDFALTEDYEYQEFLQYKINQMRWTARGIAATNTLVIDDLHHQRRLRDPDRLRRNVRVVHPLRIKSINSVSKIGPQINEYSLYYDINPWVILKEVAGGQSRRNMKLLSTKNNPYFEGLIEQYGEIPLPESVSWLDMITDEDTAKAHGNWLMRFTDERYTVDADLGHYGTQLEVGDIIYFGVHRGMPLRFLREYNFNRYFQVVSVSTKGIVRLVEVSSGFTDALI